MSQANSTEQAGSSRDGGLRSVAVVGLVIVAILCLVLAGYTALNPHTVTVTQQKLLTNTESVYFVQTQTVTSVSTATSVTTFTNVVNGYGGYLGCGYYGCYPAPGYYYPGYYPGYVNYATYQPCQPAGANNVVTCSGYLYQPPSGCTILVVPVTNNPYPSYATTFVNEYFTLQNLPSNIPASGTWVTVNGQLFQGYNTSATGASCPLSYINVSSIS
jgi:hypothetical protein